MIRPMHLSGIALAIVLAACGGAGGGYGTNPGTTSNPPGGGSAPIVMGNSVTLTSDNSFSPSNLGVVMGATVTWKWGQCSGDGYSTCVSHNVTFDDGSNMHSDTQSSGDYSRTFTAAGTYKYHCTIHGSGMSGQVVVQ